MICLGGSPVAISSSISSSIRTRVGAIIPNFAPTLAISNKHNTTLFSFFLITKSSVSKHSTSGIPSFLVHVIKFEILSLAWKVPGLTSILQGTSYWGIFRSLTKLDCTPDGLIPCVFCSFAKSLTLLAWRHRYTPVSKTSKKLSTLMVS